MARKTKYGYETQEPAADKLNYFDEKTRPEPTEATKQRSEELIEMLDKKMATKRKKKMFTKTKSGIEFEGNVSMKGIFKAIGYGALIVGFCLIIVLVFAVKMPMNIKDMFNNTVSARVLNISGNEGQPYQDKEYDITRFTSNKEGEKQRYRSLLFTLQPKQQVYIYSMQFSVKTQGTGYFSFLIVVKDGTREKVLMRNVLVEKNGQEIKFEIVIDATLYKSDVQPVTIEFKELYTGDSYEGGEIMDESVGTFSIYKLKFMK